MSRRGNPFSRNPIVDVHPDLFDEPNDPGKFFRPPATAKYIRELREAAGLQFGVGSPMVVPIAQLTEEQILALPRAAFTTSEWDELSEDQQEAIYENDAEHKKRIEAIVAPFRDESEAAETEPYLDSDIIDGIVEAWFNRNNEGDPDDLLPKDVINTVQDAAALIGVSEDEANGVLIAAFQEYMTYANAMSEIKWDRLDADQRENMHIIFSEQFEAQASLGITDGNIYKAWYEAFEDEREEAVRLINKINNWYISYSEIEEAFEREKSNRWSDIFECTIDVNLVFWFRKRTIEAIRDHCIELLNDIEVEEVGAPLPPEERRLYTWPDNFHAMNLSLPEIKQEGPAMGHCVGRPDMGYLRAVANEEAQIHSIRRPSGKRLFTIEIRFDKDFGVSRIAQVKGKANRLPGFDLGRTVALSDWLKIGKDEVEKALYYVQEVVGVPAGEISDMRPAINAINHIANSDSPDIPDHLKKWALDMKERFLDNPPPSRRLILSRNPSSDHQGHECEHGQCTGFCVPFKSDWRD